MIGKFFKIILVIIFAFAVTLAASFYIASTGWHSKTDAEVSIPKGVSVRAMGAILSDEGVIATPRLFELYVRFKGVANKLRAGTYEFSKGTTMLSAVGKLEKGDVKEYEFTIIEGWTIDDIAKALLEKPFIKDENAPAEFKRLAKDLAFMKELGVDGVPSLEGYLYPDTYHVGYPLDMRAFITRLVGRFGEVWRELTTELGDSGMPRNDIVTLASIVEKETGAPVERTLIAGLFNNRLLRGMPLQSDPTIIYGLPNFDGNLRKNDISNPHLYNTYVHPGLPPGPICNPGKASLAAALRPEKTDYLYFVSKNDGTHFFAETLAEHLKAVRRYQVLKNSDH